MIMIPANISSLFLKYVVVPLGIAAAILLACWLVNHSIRKDERRLCNMEYAAKAEEAKDKAQKKITEVRNGYRKIEKDIPAGDGNDYPSPAVDYVIDRLRERHTGE